MRTLHSSSTCCEGVFQFCYVCSSGQTHASGLLVACMCSIKYQKHVNSKIQAKTQAQFRYVYYFCDFRQIFSTQLQRLAIARSQQMDFTFTVSAPLDCEISADGSSLPLCGGAPASAPSQYAAVHSYDEQHVCQSEGNTCASQKSYPWKALRGWLLQTLYSLMRCSSWKAASCPAKHRLICCTSASPSQATSSC
jgi:hypothetical protein